MDGIPVKISEKYKPPRKFVLPGCILNRVNSDIKIEPYSFELERAVLAHIDNLKEIKKTNHERKLLKRDEWLAKTKLKSVPQEDDDYPPMDIGNQVTSGNESAMLTPVPITTNCRIESTHQIGQINLSDFENDTSSPFDNMELKTINEMEELAHVLGGTAIKSSSFSPLKNHSSNNLHPPNGCTSHQWGTSVGTTYSYPGLYSTSSNSGITGGVPITSSPHVVPGPYSYMHTANNTVYNSNIYSCSAGHNLPQTYNMAQNASHREDYTENTYRHNTYMNNPGRPPLMAQLPPNTAANYGTSANTTIDNSYKSLLPYIPSSSMPASTMYTPRQTTSLSEEASANRLTTQQRSLSPHSEEDNKVSKILEELKTQVLLRKHQIYSRPPVSSSSESIRSNKPTTRKRSEPIQANPLSQLSLQSQEFAKNMAEMGFPLPRVARAIQQFGTDEAKVLEYLLQVQSLEEQNFPAEQIEKALMLNNFKGNEAANYLESLNQLMKLGFKEEDVITALSKCSNNRDKALDVLIS